MDWQLIETAPTDGTKVWGWLYDKGIVLMHFSSAEENAAEDGSDNPDDYLSCWVLSGDPTDDYSPKFWLPFDAIKVPPGCVWTGRRWRDECDIAPRRSPSHAHSTSPPPQERNTP